MKASIEIAGTLSRLEAANERTETPSSPGMTVSTAALRVGLAHLIHEINNSIQFVYNAAHLMETYLPTDNGCRDPSMVETLEQGKGAVEHLISLMDSLRSQLESLWQMNPSFEVLNLSTLIDEILQNEAMRFEAVGIRLSKDTVDNLPLIQGNKKLLEVAFLNLFKNAADAMPEGGELRMRIGAHERSVYLEISDSGVGIPPDLDVFQPFATSKPGGMGLGLAIARHIVEAHGGTITYKSRPGEGTTFCVSFSSKVEAKNTSVPRKPVKYEYAEELYGCLCHAPRK